MNIKIIKQTFYGNGETKFLEFLEIKQSKGQTYKICHIKEVYNDMIYCRIIKDDIQTFEEAKTILSNLPHLLFKLPYLL